MDEAITKSHTAPTATQSEGVSDSPFQLTDIDRKQLSISNEDYQPHTWKDLEQIVGKISSWREELKGPSLTTAARNDLSALKRRPSDLRRYMKWTSETLARYGSITNYLCQERLNWEPLPAVNDDSSSQFDFRNAVPFADPADYKILLNDWPYGLDLGITHLVVWLKTPISVDEATGDLTASSRELIDSFVATTFIRRLGGSNGRVLWCKNWAKLQSVRSVEHFHVFVKDIPEDVLREWTSEA